MTADWSRKFDEPIALPKGRQLATLKDAGNYITKLPKAEHEAQEWQAAMEALILVATSGGPTMFARIGVMRALIRLDTLIPFGCNSRATSVGGLFHLNLCTASADISLLGDFKAQYLNRRRRAIILRSGGVVRFLSAAPF